jgi:guanylate kinase
VRAKNSGLIFVVSGPSGSGKTTLLTKLLEEPQAEKLLVKSVSLTTRPKRTGEINKKDYFFVTEKRFKELLKGGRVLEWTNFLGYYYGTPKDFVEDQAAKGRHIILCLDLKGALRIKKLYPDTSRTIFVLPPTLDALKSRIEGRCHKTGKDEISRRLKMAQREVQSRHKYDHTLVNKNLGTAVRQLRKIILKEIAV